MVTPNVFIAAKAANPVPPVANEATERSAVYKTAIITIAPRSSIIARDNRKILRDAGTDLPNKARTPNAKAMSVAAGIA